ncbi:MAG: hypothetical protein KC646_10300 [Candidatus Cloacimonetes bacterium]|nr:hypothetical protein [Candidatus Cloacimonadota bacterium]
MNLILPLGSDTRDFASLIETREPTIKLDIRENQIIVISKLKQKIIIKDDSK